MQKISVDSCRRLQRRLERDSTGSRLRWRLGETAPEVDSSVPVDWHWPRPSSSTNPWHRCLRRRPSRPATGLRAATSCSRPEVGVFWWRHEAVSLPSTSLQSSFAKACSVSAIPTSQVDRFSPVVIIVLEFIHSFV